MTATEFLLRQTAQRQMLAAFARHMRGSLLASAAAIFALLLASRFLAVVPPALIPPALAAGPALALLTALALIRRPAPRDTARLIDARAGTKELFLTAVTAVDSTEGFTAVVHAQAEERAAEIRPALIVPFPWQRGTWPLAAAAAALAASVLFLPQLDPWQKEQQRQKIGQEAQRLHETKLATARRAEELSVQAAQQSGAVAQAVAELAKIFREARPSDKEAALQRLAEQQKALGEAWRKVSQPELPNALAKAAQSFGQVDPKQLNTLREALKKGDVSALKNEITAMREQLRKLAAMPDAARRAARDALAERLNSLAQTMQQLGNSPALAAALARAQEQLGQTGQSALAKDAAQAAMDSLQLSERELQQLAQALQDGQALEAALKNLQMAKQLAAQGQLDGAGLPKDATPGDYAALFAAKMAELGTGQTGGSGMGEGIGNGARRPEDDTAASSFKSEKSTSALAGGKLLLEWKTKEVGETGARAAAPPEMVAQVRQGVSEAIQQEQVPPGYHETIKRYFDALPEPATPP